MRIRIKLMLAIKMLKISVHFVHFLNFNLYYITILIYNKQKCFGMNTTH